MKTVVLISNNCAEMTYIDNYLKAQHFAVALYCLPFKIESLQTLSCTPDVIVSDMCLPPLGAEEIFKEIDRIFSHSYYLIALVDGCSRHSADDFATAKNLHATSIIAKPFSPIDLQRCIDLLPDPVDIAL